jgi:NAD(P)-dependent dehydrogenase (short-subunit alcohol dehydrogenase family)
MIASQQIVIVTGASRGIGAATARLLGREKASVVVNYRNAKAEADAVVNGIKASGGEAFAIQGDVGSEDDVLRLFAETDRVFGPLTGLVNNAGITGGTKRRIDALTFAGIMEVMRVNVAGQLMCAREAVKRMSTRDGGKGGAIVNVSSLGALTGSPRAFIDYAASKGALDTATIGLAAETADCGIRVNAVRPGLIDTDIHADVGIPDRVKRFGPTMPIGRAGSPEEVAEAIVWLLSDKASYVTGDFINITGGAR